MKMPPNTIDESECSKWRFLIAYVCFWIVIVCFSIACATWLTNWLMIWITEFRDHFAALFIVSVVLFILESRDWMLFCMTFAIVISVQIFQLMNTMEKLVDAMTQTQ